MSYEFLSMARYIYEIWLAFFKESERIRMFNSFFFQAEDGIRDLVRSRGLGDVYKRQHIATAYQ